MIRLLFIVALCFSFVVGDYDRSITSARIESCQGCSLNRLPQVRQFIEYDVPKYDKVHFKPIRGAPPELVLLSTAGEEIHRLPLSRLTRLECNELLETYGFTKDEEETIGKRDSEL